MKEKLVILFILIANCFVKGQVADFNINLSGFVPHQSTLNRVTNPLNTIDNSPYITVEENLNLAGFAVHSYDKSDFVQIYSLNTMELCFDYKVIDDAGQTNFDFFPQISISTKGTTAATGIDVAYISNVPVDENSDWANFCAPLWTCSNGYPTNANGQWYIRNVGSQWLPIDSKLKWENVLFRMTTGTNTTIDIVLHGNQMNGQAGTPNVPGEIIGYDNIFFVTKSNIYSNTIKIDGPDDILYTCNFPINLNTSLTSTAPPESLFSYRWFVDGQEIIGVNNPTYVLEDQFGNEPVVRVEVTDPNGCVEFDELEIKSTGFDINVNDVFTCTFPIDIGHTGVSWNLPYGSGVPQGIGSYLWNTGETTQKIEVNQAGIYTVTITDLMGCSDSKDIVVTTSNTIVDAGSDVDHCGVGPVNLTGTISGGSATIENWIFDGNIVSNSQTCQATESGLYTYEITDDNGCIISDEIEVIIRDLRLIPGPSINTCNQSGTFTATVSSAEDDPISIRIFVQSDPDRISIPNSESVITGPCPQGSPCATSYTFTAPHPYEIYVMEAKQGVCTVWRVFEVEINDLSLIMDDIVSCDFPNFAIDPSSGLTYSGNTTNLVYQWDLPNGSSSSQMPLIVNQDENTVETYTLTVSAPGTNCSVTQEFDLTHYCDDPCITFEDKQALFQKKLENSTLTNRIFSTKIYDDEIYSLHLDAGQIGSCGGMTLVSVTDLSGDVLRSKRYSSFNGTCVYPKEMHVLDEGIFVLANKGSWDNVAVSPNMGTVLIKIDPLTLNVIWSMEYNMNITDANHSDEDIFINAFSPKYNEGELVGFLMVGNTRRKTTTYLRMNSYFMTVDADGNTLNRKELLTDISCGKNCAGDTESQFAVDISDQVKNENYEYAVLLESRNSFTGQLKSNQGIKMSYVFLDWDLNINSLASSDPYWFSNVDTKTEINPRKIYYESRENGEQLVVKIAGQYMNNQKGFVSQFDNYFDAGSNQYSLYNLSPFSTDIVGLNESQSFDGAVDFIEKDNITYVLGNRIIVALDMLGGFTSVMNESPRFNFPFYSLSDFGWTGGYIGGLIHEHPQSGFLVNGIRTPNYVKTRDNLGITCPSENINVDLSPISIDEGKSIKFKEKSLLEQDLAVLTTSVALDLQSECCSNDEIIKDPCDIAVDVDYEVDCEGNVTINSISVPPSKSLLTIEYFDEFNNFMLSIEYPGSFQMKEGTWRFRITMVLSEGCEKIWESDEITVLSNPETEELNLTTCLECISFQPDVNIEFLSFYSYNESNYFGGEEQCLGIGEHTFQYFDEKGCLLKTQTIVVSQGEESAYDISDMLPCISVENIFNGGFDPDPDGSETMAVAIPFDASYLWGFCQPNNGLISGWSTGSSVSTNYPDASSHILTYPGDFSFTTTLENGCPCTVYGTVLPCPWLRQPNSSAETRSVSDQLNSISYKLVPNPSDGIFRIENSEDVINYDKVSVLSTTGQLISEYQNVEASKMYDLSTYRDGLYLIRVTTGKQTKLLKMILHP